MTTHAKRVIMCVMASGLLLAACSSAASTLKAPKSQRELETAACKLISVPPKPATGTGSFEAISMPISTLSALKKTGDSSLQNVVRDFDAAASTQNTVEMIRALSNGVKVCHDLGLKTAT